MLHYVENGREAPLVWRDLSDIREEMKQVGQRIAAAHERYAALGGARNSITHYPEEEETRRLLDTLMEEARAALHFIAADCRRMNSLQKEMRETGCLLSRM